MRSPAFLAALLLVFAAQHGRAAERPLAPSVRWGALYAAVEERRLFPDSKTFADAVPKRPAADILRDYAALTAPDDVGLRAFVLANFDLPVAPAARPIERAPTMKAHIAALWPLLTRQPVAPPPGSSALSLPRAYVVPGGRFRELYYWDSYFTMLGLKRDGQQAAVEAMIDDFMSLVERYGHVPNGTRSYYLGRSQPPLLAPIMALSTTTGRTVLRRRLAALRREHDFWMAGGRVVTMPDGSRLNRYWGDLLPPGGRGSGDLVGMPGPRDESWAEDVATASAATGRLPEQVYRDLRAAAESGWDFSSRWLGDGRTLATIRTTRIVPVDLNAFLYSSERWIAARCSALGDKGCSRRFATAARQRHAAIDRYLWSGAQGRYGDWDLDAQAITDRPSAATLVPLFVHLSSATQANAVARFTAAHLLAPGGLRTTTVATGQQWDAPNGWAPLQWMAVAGLAENGEPALARAIGTRFLATVAREYRASGKMLEKYDVEAAKPGGGGEYPTQDGFGWTNGVTRVLIDLYGEPAAG